MLIAAPSWLAAQEGRGDYDHGQVGIFADYFRFSPTSSNTTNFVGFGARTGFNVSHFTQIEAEMNYDFERNFTSTFNNGVSTQFVTTRVRPLTGLFGPKFQTPGPFKFFVTGKVGFINFTKTNAAVTPGTVGNAISGVAMVARTWPYIQVPALRASGDRSVCGWKRETKCSSTTEHSTT